MSLLIPPLILLGLVGILILIIIYIIKPNYQQKAVSSTFIWRLSLKYKRKKLPVNKLRNILLFVCQLLTLTAMGLIMAHPVQPLEQGVPQSDVVYIIDSSASMYAGSNNETRFSRAVSDVLYAVEDELNAGSYVSVILADGSPDFLVERATLAEKNKVTEALEGLLEDETACSYGTSDVQAAIALSGRIVTINPSAKVCLYTDTEYEVTEGIEVISVAEKDEWNVAILDGQTDLSDGYYSLTVDVASYGVDADITVSVLVEGANSADNNDTTGKTIEFQHTVTCRNNESSRIVFTTDSTLQDDQTTSYYLLGESTKFYSYQSILISVDDQDSFQVDNTFLIYGGHKQVIKVQYASSLPNPFMNSVLDVLKDRYVNEWDVQITEVKQGEEAATTGYDFYIFEHEMPDILPLDGAVLLVDPDKAPAGAGFTVKGRYSYGNSLVALSSADPEHVVMKGINAQRIGINQYLSIIYGSDYDVLMNFQSGDPALAVCNDKANQVAVLSFSLHYSNLPLLQDFPILMNNLFTYFFPSMIEHVNNTSGNSNTYEVGEEMILQARGDSISVESANYTGQDKVTFTEFPASLVLSLPGTYTVSQNTYFNKLVQERIYVHTPVAESNIQASELRLDGPTRPTTTEQGYDDWLIYFAAALVALLFIEWMLKSRENA